VGSGVAGVAIGLWPFGDVVTGDRSLSRVSLAVSTVAFLSAAACGSAGGPLTATTMQNQMCPRLDSQLFQLTQSPDPDLFASGTGLDLNPSGVRVVIKLAAGTDLPPGHRVAIEAHFANAVQARVPVIELCGLAREPSVISVGPPARPISGGARP